MTSITMYSSFTTSEYDILIKSKIYKSLPKYLCDKFKSLTPWTTSYSEAKYCLKNNIVDRPFCLYCNMHPVEFNNNQSVYYKCCSPKCVKHQRKKTSEQTWLSNYGVSHPFLDAIVQGKRQQTLIENYGVTNPFLSDVVQERCLDTKQEIYGDRKYNNSNKANKTKSERPQDKKDEEIFKTKASKMLKYNDPNYNNRQKSENTCNNKYGVRSVSQVSHIHYKQQKYRWYSILSPNGVDVKVQGYERFVVPKLWEEYGEGSVVIDRYKFPIILYTGTDNKTHRYYPDVIIGDKIIEIKSTWTLKTLYNKFEPLYSEILRLGYEFEVIVHIPKYDQEIIASTKKDILSLFDRFII